MKILNEELNWGLSKFPSCTGILNRVQKSGYSIYEETDSLVYAEGYALTVDESMMVGSEKLLLTMGVPAAKKEEESLMPEDVRILDMEIKKSWNSEGIREAFSKVGKKWKRHRPV